MRMLAIIPARGGSKGLPRKNILPLGGKPLIARTIEHARHCPSISRTIVSTDNDEIAAIARTYGAEVPWMRPAELATDVASGADVIRHALLECEKEEGMTYGAVIVLQPTSPLRGARDVEEAIVLFTSSGAPNVISVCELEHPLAWTVCVDKDGVMRPHPAATSADYRTGRQGQEKCYRLNGAIYIYRRESVLNNVWGVVEGTRAYVMPAERSIDIDTEFDMAMARALLNRE